MKQCFSRILTSLHRSKCPLKKIITSAIRIHQFTKQIILHLVENILLIISTEILIKVILKSIIERDSQEVSELLFAIILIIFKSKNVQTIETSLRIRILAGTKQTELNKKNPPQSIISLHTIERAASFDAQAHRQTKRTHYFNT